MMKTCLLPVALLGLVAAAAPAQTIPSSGGLPGALGGLLGGGLPAVGSTSAGNAAGLLGYCVKNNVVSGANAGSVLGRLTQQQGVATSGDYLAGQQGQLQAGGQSLSLADMKGRVRTKVCNLVLKHARSFL